MNVRVRIQYFRKGGRNFPWFEGKNRSPESDASTHANERTVMSAYINEAIRLKTIENCLQSFCV